MFNNIEIESREVLSNYKFPLQKISYRQKGEDKTISRETYLPPDSVTALLYNQELKTVVLTRQFRLATFVNGLPNGMLLETCAGIIDEGESPETTIVREIKEETGYELTAVQKLFTLYSTPGSVTERLHYFVAACKAADKASEGGAQKMKKLKR